MTAAGRTSNPSAPANTLNTLPSMQQPLELPPSTLRLPVAGRHLLGPTLGDQITDQPVLLCFLRHFG